MGQAVGELLMRGGVTVAVTLAGRSERTRALAHTSGFAEAPSVAALVHDCELVLSVVPPAQALAVANDVAAAIESGRRTVFVDCNAISPRRVREVAAVIGSAGVGFVDAAIIGGPPRNAPSPRFYASGPDRARFAELRDAGLEIVTLGPAVGEASAVKMCYAALTKGTTAIATELLVAARKLGVYDTIVAELEGTPSLLSRTQGVASMPGKAHRWIAEMEEIARTFAEVGLTPRIFEGAADMYRLTAESEIGGERPETVDRSRGLAGTVDVLSRASEQIGSSR